jgi:hypothetical protein
MNAKSVIDDLRAEQRPLTERADVITAHEVLARVRGDLTASSTALERARAQLEQIEAAAANAVAEGNGIDTRRLASARAELASAESEQRIRVLAVQQAQKRVADVESQARVDIIGACRTAYQTRVVELDRALATAATINLDLHAIATTARALLAGPDANEFLHWAPLASEKGNCQYLWWREIVTRYGYQLPEPSLAHVLPRKVVAVQPSIVGWSNDRDSGGNNQKTIVVGPSGLPLPQPRDRGLRQVVTRVGRVVSAILLAGWLG